MNKKLWNILWWLNLCVLSLQLDHIMVEVLRALQRFISIVNKILFGCAKPRQVSRHPYLLRYCIPSAVQVQMTKWSFDEDIYAPNFIYGDSGFTSPPISYDHALGPSLNGTEEEIQYFRDCWADWDNFTQRTSCRPDWENFTITTRLPGDRHAFWNCSIPASRRLTWRSNDGLSSMQKQTLKRSKSGSKFIHEQFPL